MPDPVTIGVNVLVALGAAVGGYLSAPKKMKYCDFHEAMKSRLTSGDKRFHEFETAIAATRDAAHAAAQAAERSSIQADAQIATLGEVVREVTAQGKLLARIDERTIKLLKKDDGDA